MALEQSVEFNFKTQFLGCHNDSVTMLVVPTHDRIYPQFKEKTYEQREFCIQKYKDTCIFCNTLQKSIGSPLETLVLVTQQSRSKPLAFEEIPETVLRVWKCFLYSETAAASDDGEQHQEDLANGNLADKRLAACLYG